jgi:GNAT superfamily N-acetyltransferase
VTGIELRAVTAAETRPLRHAVLRPTQAPDELVFSGDLAADTLHLGAFLDGRLIGIASVSRESCRGEPDADAWRLQGMAVVAGAQGHGVGRLLLERCIAHVADSAGTLVWCEGRSGIAGFYRSLGFELSGEEFVKPISGPHYIMKRRIAPSRV